MQERYGEALPKDIEAARAWWKANEKRFAAKETTAHKSATAAGSNSVPAVDPKRGAAPKQQTDARAAAEITSHGIRWPVPTAILAALLVTIAGLWLKRR